MTTTSYAVDGLTCGYCIAEVMEQVRELVGVTGVAVDLVKNGSSPVVVTSGPELEIDEVREVLDHAGFDLAGVWANERDGHQAHRAGEPAVRRRADESSTERRATSSLPATC